MKHLIICAALLGTPSGCALHHVTQDGQITQTEYDAIAIEWNGYLQDLQFARDAGLISEEEMHDTWAPIILAGDEALDALEAATASGPVSNQDAAAIAARAAMRRIMVQLIAAQIRETPNG